MMGKPNFSDEFKRDAVPQSLTLNGSAPNLGARFFL